MNAAALWTAGGGLAIGIACGIVMQRSRFCMVAAVTNLLVIREFRYTQAFLAAWAVAIFGTALLEAYGYVHIAESAYRAARIDWLGAIGGGIAFGFGAALAGGCAARTLVNAAEGQTGSLLVLIVLATVAGLAQYGMLEPLRIALEQRTAIVLPAGDSSLARLLYAQPLTIAAGISTGCIIALFALGRIRENAGLILAGTAVGLLTVAGWLLTGRVAQDEFMPTAPVSLKVTGPLARLAYGLYSGSSQGFDFGIAFVGGTLAGAAASAMASGRLRWTPPDRSRLPHGLIGGTLMGVGAAFAGGCNIGQGLSGVSTLSVTSLLAAGSIVAGAALGVLWWSRRA